MATGIAGGGAGVTVAAAFLVRKSRIAPPGCICPKKAIINICFQSMSAGKPSEGRIFSVRSMTFVTMSSIFSAGSGGLSERVSSAVIICVLL